MLQAFVDKIGPVIGAAWLNQVDTLKETVFESALNKPEARTKLTVDAPLEIINGGTGQRTLEAFMSTLYPYFIAQTAREASLGIDPPNKRHMEGNLLRYLDPAQTASFLAGNQAENLTVPYQNWANVAAGRIGWHPQGSGKITAPIQVAGATSLFGEGQNARVLPWGCSAFQVNGDGCQIDNLGLFSADAFGFSDPRTLFGIVANGTKDAHINRLILSRLYCQGWNVAADLRYTWRSKLIMVNTIVTNTALRLFGQSVANTVLIPGFDCMGNSCVSIVKDAAEGLRGEGLTILGGDLTTASSAVVADSFLEFAMLGTTCDLLTGIGLDFADVQAVHVNIPWMACVNECLKVAAQAGDTQADYDVTMAYATQYGAAPAVYWGANNKGLNLNGSYHHNSASDVALNLEGDEVIVKCRLRNGSTSPAIYVNGYDVNVDDVVGDCEAQYVVSQRMTAPAATGNVITLPSPRSGRRQLHVNFTGTNPCQTLIDPVAWQDIELVGHFTTAMTFNSGGNLKLAGGTFTSSPNDTLRLVPDGTVWEETGRSVNT